MKQEEIAKQAEQYATSRLIDTSNYSLQERRKLLDCDNYDLKQAFIDGAEWHIKSVWHTNYEVPDYENRDREYYLIESNTGLFDVCIFVRVAYGIYYFQGDSTKYEFEEIKYWAYINDLKHERN